jgi:hypothetical protein
MSETTFWDDLKNRAQEIKDRFTFLWAQAGMRMLTQAEAQETLQVLWEHSHLLIMEHMSGYMKYFPTKQCYPGKLKNVEDLWWVDHATAGVNGWGTLGWFSSKPRKHSKKFETKASAEKYAKRRKGKMTEKDGEYIVTWTGYAGACTHFVAFADGTPFYLVKIEDGCWGEPKRNGDGIHIEMVNALVCRLKDGLWHFWAGPLPQKVLDVQQPVALDKKFRGATHMLPYTWDQVITCLKLKRICVAATGGIHGRMHPDRMSQHTDWRTTKFDMGPLWPFDVCNSAAFEGLTIEDYEFVQQFVKAPGADRVVDPEELEQLAAYAEDPEQEHDLWDEDDSIDSTKEIQEVLVKIYGDKALPKFGPDGFMGLETTTAVRHFQEDWNRNNPDDRIKVDGVPGTQTCKRLEKALELGTQFQTT